MECIYYPALGKDSAIISVTGDEARHLRALNTKSGDELMVSSGNGLCATGIANRVSRTDFTIEITGLFEGYGERNARLGLAMGILDRRERFEFAVEKAVELGATNIYPLVTQFTQRNKIDNERITAKCIAALKQCRRSRLPEISGPVRIDEICKEFEKYKNILLMDENGTKMQPDMAVSDTIVIVGPEGGFSGSETNKLQEFGAVPTNIGNRRLRAETAAVAALSFFSLV